MVRLSGPRDDSAAVEAPTLVQRSGELDLCGRVLDSIPGPDAFLIVEGAAGSGKSALLEAVCRLAESRGLLVRRAAGSELERSFAHGVVRQLLEPLDAEGAGQPVRGAWTHDAFLRRLRGLSAAQDLLLAVDDLELVDEPSLELLESAAQRQTQLRVAVVATLHPALGAAAGEPLSLLRIQRRATTCRLRALDASGVEQLLAQAGTPAPPGVCREVTRVTGGNPFLLTALLDRLHRDGVPLLDGIRDLDDESFVPLEVTRELALRLTRLPAAAQLLADTVAVLGDGASVQDAARVMNHDAIRVLDSLDALAAADVLERGDDLRFCQPLLRTAVYGMLPRGERSRLHRAAAEVLSMRDSTAAEVAAHLVRCEGGGDDWAVEPLRAAAMRARTPTEAVIYLSRALSEDPAPELRAELLEELAGAEFAGAEFAGGGTQAARHLTQAVELLPSGAHRAAACEQLGRVRWGLGRYTEAESAFADGVSAVGAGSGALASRLRAARAAARRLLHGPGAGVLPKVKPALASSHTEDPAVLAQVALELALRGDARDGVVALAEAALRRGSLLGQQTACGPAYQATVCVLLWADELGAAEHAAALGSEDAAERDMQPALGVMLQLRACALFRRGLLDETESVARSAAPLVPPLLPVPVPHPEALLAEVELERDQPAAARRGIERSLSGGTNDAEPSPAASVRHAFSLLVRARVELAEGDAESALAGLLETGERLRAAGVHNPAVAPWRSHAALAALQAGKRARAASLNEEDLQRARLFGAPRARGVALEALAFAQPHPEDRRRTLENALEALYESPALLDRARLHAHLGAELRRGGQRRAARDSLRRALDLAERCGATALAKRARQDLVATGARPRRALLSGLPSLTPRERQVAELAAGGRSNRDIARRLIVSEKTIEWHLGNAYRKLEVRSRTDLRECMTDR
jgi:DNA-binding CsgD family transcriptional regulator